MSSSARDDCFETCDPPAPNFKDVPEKLIKYGGTLKMQKTRYFLVDDYNLLYFSNKTDKIAKGFKPLKGASSRVESRD